MRLLIILMQEIILLYGSQLKEYSRLFDLSGPLDNLRFAGYGLIMVVGIATKNSIRSPKPMDIVMSFIFIFAFYSYTYSFDPELTLWRSIAIVLMYVAIFWSLWGACRTPDDGVKFVRALLFSWLLFYAANAVFVLLKPGDCFNLQDEQFMRFHGLASGPNSMGDFSAFILPLAFWNFLTRRNFTSTFLLVAVALSLLASFSRNALVCGLIGMNVFFYVSLRDHKAFRAMFTVFMVLLGLLYAKVFGLLVPIALIRGEENLAMLGGRIEAWKAAIELIRRAPYLGYGFGTESLLFRYFEFRFAVHSGDYAHNSFIGFILQIGIIATSLFYISFIMLLVRSYQDVLKIQNRYKPFVLALFSCSLAGFLTSFSESWFYSPGSILPFPYYICLMLLSRMIEFDKVAAREAHGKAVQKRRRRRWFSLVRKFPA